MHVLCWLGCGSVAQVVSGSLTFEKKEGLRNRQVCFGNNGSSQVYLDHIHKSSRMYGVGRVEAASFKPFQQILRWAFWKRRKSEISGFDPAAMDRAKFYLNNLHLEHPHLGCWLGCGRVSQNPKELWRLSSLNYSLRTDQKRNKWIQKIWRMAMDAGRWTQAWTPLLKKGLSLTLYKTEHEVAHMCQFTDPKLLFTSQKPSKPLHRIESKHTNNPFISFLQPGVSILNRLPIRHEDLPYLPHNCFSTLWGALKLRNYLHLFFFTRRKETKGSPQRMYQHILHNLYFKEVAHAKIGSLLAYISCREIA